MRVVIQRVKEASVSIGGAVHSSIGPGLLVFLGAGHHDNEEDVEWLSRKVAAMRIFPDEHGKMNLDVTGAGGQLLVVSQFTLHASTKKGNRPSFGGAAPPENARRLYLAFVDSLSALLNQPCRCGVFGADMQVRLVNDGPVTIVIDSRNKE